MNLMTGGISALVSIGGLVSLATVGSLSAHQSSTSAVIEAATSLGINAESLAGVGVQSGGVDDVLDALMDRMDEFGTLAGLEATLRTLQSELSAARESLREDAGDVSAQLALDRAEDRAAAARQSISRTREAILLAVLRGQAEPDAVRRVFLGLHDAQRLPIAYRFAPESEGESTRLAWALDITRVSEARGETPPPDARSAVSTAAGQVDVQLAIQNVALHTDQNRVAIDHWAAQR